MSATVPWRVAVPLLVVLALAAVQGMRVARGNTPVMDQVGVYVAVPADVPINYGVADAALHEADLAMRWLEQQAGRRFNGSVAFARILTTTSPQAAYQGSDEVAYEALRRDVLLQVDDPHVFPVILADVRTELDDAMLLTCGLGSPMGLVMFLRNCPGDDLSVNSSWGSAASITIAHELVHGMGAVAPCGRHASADGHVVDDMNDVVRASTGPWPPGHLVTLDAGHDDYFDHDIPGCPDIADSPLWAPA